VKKLSRAILIAFGVVGALVVAAVFGVNLYIQSPGVQALIQEEISRALRLPLRITNSSVSPWGDLSITGITIPHGENGGTNLLEAAAFRARYRVLPLFTGRLIIHDMSVENPKLIWPQDAEGKWTLPKPERAAAKSAAAPPSGVATPAPAAASPAAEVAKKDAAPKKKRGLQVTVDGFEIRHGHVELLNTAREPVAVFSDVNMRYTTLTPERIEGVATFASIVSAGGLVFENVRTPFNYTPAALDLPQLTATLAGGPVTGSFKVRSAEPKSPFEIGLRFEEVDIAKIAAAAKWGEGQAAGLAAGTLELRGTFAQFARSEGNVEVTLRDGRFHEFGYFEMIGQALQIKQLSDLRLKDSTATARVADEKLFFENITLDAAQLQLSAKGIARFDGKLQFAARLTAQEALIKQLPSLVRDNFAAGENATRTIDFNITGKAAKPKTDLLDKIVGKKLEDQFEDLVGNLFGNRKKKDDEKKDDGKKSDKKKKKKDEPEPDAARLEAPATLPAPPASASNPQPTAPQ